MRRIKSLRMAAAVLALVLAGACTSAIFRQPRVALQSVQIGGLGLTGGTLLVNLSIVNPNRFGLSTSGLEYDLALRDPNSAPGDTSWVDFAQGDYDQPFSVAAHDSATVQIPVQFSYSGLGSAGNSLLRSGTFTYRASGTVHVGTPLGSHAVPFTKHGTVTLLGTK
ncbi:MAG TPA: LEA type 2 family protein [Longimicrobiaceae bacterium]|nr:LEA type 2 family protein [Longimicrobiaceae bacterium]